MSAGFSKPCLHCGTFDGIRYNPYRYCVHYCHDFGTDFCRLDAHTQIG